MEDCEFELWRSCPEISGVTEALVVGHSAGSAAQGCAGDPRRELGEDR